MLFNAKTYVPAPRRKPIPCAVELDLDEMECILANLIFQNKIKGYISHQKRFLIVSKADPFPIAAVVRKVAY